MFKIREICNFIQGKSAFHFRLLLTVCTALSVTVERNQ